MGIYPINILYAVWNENDIKVELRFESDAYTVVGIKSGLSGTYKIVIPEYYDGYPVTKIVDNAFYNNNSITAITITKNITVVGDKAFL